MTATQLKLFDAREVSTNSREGSRQFRKYPDGPGFKAAGASQEAAQEFGGKVTRLRAEVLAELERWPDGKTADENAILLQRSPLSIRPRMSELRTMGKVLSTGNRRRNESGMSATVWKVAAA
jgi:hypothetical protein